MFDDYSQADYTQGGLRRTKDEALKNINEVVRMIVEEFTEEGRPLPEGPSGDVDVVEISKEEPRIGVTV